MTIYKNIALANWFLTKGIESTRPLTQMQLQKMIYFAHALNLATRSKALALGNFEAWIYGPVLPDVYHVTKHWGAQEITERLVVPDLESNDLIIPLASDSVLPLLEIVWRNFSKYDGVALSHISHEVGGPWDSVYEDGKREKIPNSLIEQFYKTRILDLMDDGKSLWTKISVSKTDAEEGNGDKDIVKGCNTLKDFIVSGHRYGN